jgi:lysophospholipase L1-like esterase
VDTSFKPDVIVVNHGTNDNVSANDTTFIKALKDALECLMEKYPDTPIFYMMPFSQRSVGAIQKTLDTYFADADITVVETASWGITTTLGPAFLTDTLHPNAVGAKVAGVKLAAAIEAKLGEDFFKVN